MHIMKLCKHEHNAKTLCSPIHINMHYIYAVLYYSMTSVISLTEKYT